MLSFGSRNADQYGSNAVAFMEQVAAHVGIAVDNAINFDDTQRLRRELSGERDRLRLLLEMNTYSRSLVRCGTCTTGHELVPRTFRLVTEACRDIKI